MKTKLSLLGPLAFGLLLTGAIAALGHGGATGIVGERMMGMMMLGEQIKLMGPVVEQPSAGDVQTLKTASEMISMHAGRAMTDLFPEGSLDAPSEARPEIWERWQEFSAYATELGTLGEELGASAAALGMPALPDPVPNQTLAAVPEPVLSEWERMDFEWLMGIAPQQEAIIDAVATGSIATPEPEPAARPVSQVYADIAATCAACHAAFRR
ncbi:c-type cytochrome [Devosia rhizoryzae]|uniref:Cytochrome c n=1 Tax=Devosia rhizoryzae TaxID=2774137 RepID=A0ABX7CBE2_9HYPH|nr:cytochrome c [Devosia rhizoryzae]QQR40077.1 cytochrome c [Devosia rhizoryzae]